MAVVRARSAPPYGAFVGFFLFGVTAVAAVVLYVMYANRLEEINNANKALALVGSNTDANEFRTNAGVDRDNTMPALRLANTRLTTLKKDLAASEAENKSLKDQLAQQQTSLKDFEKLANEAKMIADGRTKEMQSMREAFDKMVQTLNEDNVRLNAEATKAQRDRDAAIATGQDQMNSAVESAELLRRPLVLQIEQDKSEIEKLTQEVRELRQRILNASGRQGTPNVGEPDGTIVRVNQATGEAYILLGKKDRIMPGMTFTAYDPRLGVRFGTDETAAGNGSLEVIEVGETTSICRITRTTPNKAIQAGDLISNIVYHNDRTRLFRFVVRGDFDLDGDGVATAAERDRIVRFIVAWGGRVDENVTSQTDYLVTGERPTSIASIEQIEPGTAIPEPDVNSVAGQRKKEQESYEDVIVQAKRLAIPVLNANRFLAMIGYYNTTIVRYGSAK